MKNLIGHYLLRPLGLAYDIRKPRARSSGSPDESTRWELNEIRLRAGWYMLEVEHSLKSIGCVLTVETGIGCHNHVLLTSKPVCKRIIKLDRYLSQCSLQIDQAECSLTRVSFTRLSAGFAERRMRQRLSNRGHNKQVDGVELPAVYSIYNEHVNAGIFELPYRPMPVDLADEVSIDSNIEERLADVMLLLVSVDRRKNSISSNDSVDIALNFARQRGWLIEWLRADETDVDVRNRCPQARMFIMPVNLLVDYRADVFHNLLNAIESESILIYADHDNVDDFGVFHSPVFKPEWNPELLLNTNYIQVPWMISASWAWQAIGTGRAINASKEFDRILLAAALGISKDALDSQGKDTLPSNQLLQCSCSHVDKTHGLCPLSEQQVKRIPLVLASVHAPLNSVYAPDNEDTGTRSGNLEYWRNLVDRSLQLAGKRAEVVRGRYKGRHHIRWSLTSAEPSVDIIIPTRDKVNVLQTCIESVLEKTNYRNFQIHVVDNDSRETLTSQYYEKMKEEKRFKLLRYAGAFNYSAINNFAVKRTRADVLVLLNNDTEVISPDWLNELVRQALRPEIGCVGAKLYYSNGRIQHGGVITGINGVAGHAHRYSPGNSSGYCGRLSVPQNFSAVTAACLAVRRSIWLEAKGLDEENLGVAWNDVDFCLRVQALGYRNLWTPYAELFHHEGLSRGADDTRSKIDRVNSERRFIMGRWQLDRFTDPAYHPLLTRDNESFTLDRTFG